MYGLLAPHLDSPGYAIELGCGVGHGVLWLLDQGWEVLANDSDPEAITIVRERSGDHPKLKTSTEPMQDLALGDPDLIVAGFSLFFLQPEVFAEFFPRMLNSLAPGGLFCGQLLGINDAWRERGYVLHDEKRLRSELSGMEILHWEEVERDGETALGEPKHWHVFHVIARSPA